MSFQGYWDRQPPSFNSETNKIMRAVAENAWNLEIKEQGGNTGPRPAEFIQHPGIRHLNLLTSVTDCNQLQIGVVNVH